MAAALLLLSCGEPLAQQPQQTVAAPAHTPASPVAAQQPAATQPATTQNGAAPQSGGAAQHPPPAAAATSSSNLSKFEARRVRHACLEHANEKTLKGKEREEFLTRCIFGRSAMRRTVRRECRKQGLAKNLDRAALRDFIHQCAEAYYAAQKPAE